MSEKKQSKKNYKYPKEDKTKVENLSKKKKDRVKNILTKLG